MECSARETEGFDSYYYRSRLNTIRDSDMIVVLQNGQVEEFGSFDTLMNREGSVLKIRARGTD